MRVSNLISTKQSHFIALMGQSNAAGFQSPSDTNTYLPEKGQYIFDNYSASWEALQQNWNNGDVPDFTRYTGSVGCEMHLMHLMQEYYGADQYLFKYSDGGTSIDPTDDPDPTKYNWGPSSANPYMFKGCVNSYRQAISKFPAQRQPMKVLIWIQGEDDSDLDRANHYQENFETLIRALKNSWNCPDLKVLQTLLADTQTAYGGLGKTIVNEAKINFSVNGNRYVNIDGADCPGGVHFSAAGQAYIAEKLFEVLKTML